MLRIAIAISLLGLCFAIPALAREQVRVYAAASLTDVIGRLEPVYERDCDCDLKPVFAGSGTLARQIHSGAEVDVFISADDRWVDWLEDADVAFTDRQSVAENTLVVASAKTDLDLKPEDFTQQRFVMGEPDSVPVGAYARSALSIFGVWEGARKKAIFSENARVATSLIRRGDVAFGLVYRSDALAARLNIVSIISNGVTGPIRYEAVSFGANGGMLLDWLQSTKAQAIFSSLGFKPSRSP